MVLGYNLYMARLWNSCVYQTQDEVVADQFWVCGNKTLRATLPKLWKGRCARVQVVTEVVILPSLDGIDGKDQVNTDIGPMKPSGMRILVVESCNDVKKWT